MAQWYHLLSVIMVFISLCNGMSLDRRHLYWIIGKWISLNKLKGNLIKIQGHTLENAKFRPFCPGSNVLICNYQVRTYSPLLPKTSSHALHYHRIKILKPVRHKEYIWAVVRVFSEPRFVTLFLGSGELQCVGGRGEKRVSPRNKWNLN